MKKDTEKFHLEFNRWLAEVQVVDRYVHTGHDCGFPCSYLAGTLQFCMGTLTTTNRLCSPSDKLTEIRPLHRRQMTTPVAI